MLCKSMNWFLYHRDLRHFRKNSSIVDFRLCFTYISAMGEYLFKLDNKNRGANSVDVDNIELVFLQRVEVVAHIQCSWRKNKKTPEWTIFYLRNYFFIFHFLWLSAFFNTFQANVPFLSTLNKLEIHMVFWCSILQLTVLF